MLGDAMDVEEISPTTSTSSGSSTNIKLDGIDIDTEHLERKELVAKLVKLVDGNIFVLLSSPAGSGKSSLFKLLKRQMKGRKVIGISFLKDGSGIGLLSKAGIDLENETTASKLSEKRSVIFIDDAQAKYGEVSFWAQLIKSSGLWLPSHVRFIISATHSFSGEKESPVEFSSLSRLQRDDFLLSNDEAYEFLNLPNIGLPANLNIQKLKDILVNECGGLIAALRLSVDSLKERFMKDMQPAEIEVFNHCLSKRFAERMARCFGSDHLMPIGSEFKEFLKKCFANEMNAFNDQDNADDVLSYTWLKKSGILVEMPDSTFTFSSPLAKRYYSSWIFPKRSQDNPLTLFALIRRVITSMSSSVLKNSTTIGDFPKEATFQHLFMEGIANFTKPSCSICPELSKIFPNDTSVGPPEEILGEIDFYLNSSLRWGVELLVNGRGITEHIDRFGEKGKYFPLKAKDYVVVDIRGNANGEITRIIKHSKRISVFFKLGEFKSCKCIFGEEDQVIEIDLAD